MSPRSYFQKRIFVKYICFSCREWTKVKLTSMRIPFSEMICSVNMSLRDKKDIK